MLCVVWWSDEVVDSETPSYRASYRGLAYLEGARYLGTIASISS